ncbi:MAG TPA: GFA family protein [Xanthobacteraceae bacterium]|nr:GFA family protein [Xanthobacteraceae bacterium]
MKVDGACHCRAIAVEGEVDPEKVTICRCTDCQSGAGSAFRVSIPVPGDTFKMTGQPALYVKSTAESGNPRAQAFCPKCGSPIYSTTPGDGPKDSYMVRVGILRQRDQLRPRRQIWFRSAQSWVTELGGIPRNETQQGTSHLR